MSYTETANKRSADLNNVSPNRVPRRCDAAAVLLLVETHPIEISIFARRSGAP